jgi:hypothetical protein
VIFTTNTDYFPTQRSTGWFLYWTLALLLAIQELKFYMQFYELSLFNG